MPSLEWIGKDKVIAHHQDVPVHELVHQYGFTIDGKQEEPTNSNNMIFMAIILSRLNRFCLPMKAK